MNVRNIIVGLGNPGNEYAQTRHNVGFMVVDEMCRQITGKWQNKSSWSLDLAEWVSDGQKTLFIKPLTYMNDSGRALRQVVDFYRFDEFDRIWVIHDDLDIPLGSTKVQLGTGPKIHNGLSSIYDHLSSKDFWHVRIGVDGRGGDRSLAGRDYVLLPFTPTERAVVTSMISETAKDLFNRVTAWVLPSS